MRCMHRGDVVGREILPDKTLGKRVVVTDASCPRDSTHDVYEGGRYLGSYCEKHDHPSRTVKTEPRSTVSVWVHDAHTGDRVGSASYEEQKRRQIGVPYDVVDGGVKRRLVLRAYATTPLGNPVR